MNGLNLFLKSKIVQKITKNVENLFIPADIQSKSVYQKKLVEFDNRIKNGV